MLQITKYLKNKVYIISVNIGISPYGYDVLDQSECGILFSSEWGGMERLLYNYIVVFLSLVLSFF